MIIDVPFERDTDCGKFCDCLYVDDSLTPEEIEALIQERVDVWVALVAAASSYAGEELGE